MKIEFEYEITDPVLKTMLDNYPDVITKAMSELALNSLRKTDSINFLTELFVKEIRRNNDCSIVETVVKENKWIDWNPTKENFDECVKVIRGYEFPKELNGIEFVEVKLKSGRIIRNNQAAYHNWRPDGCIISYRITEPPKPWS